LAERLVTQTVRVMTSREPVNWSVDWNVCNPLTAWCSGSAQYVTGLLAVILACLVVDVEISAPLRATVIDW